MYYGAPGIKVTPTIEGKDAKVEIEVYGTDLPTNYEYTYAIYDKDVWLHLLTEMLEDTINFWNKQGYDAKIKKL